MVVPICFRLVWLTLSTDYLSHLLRTLRNEVQVDSVAYRHL